MHVTDGLKGNLAQIMLNATMRLLVDLILFGHTSLSAFRWQTSIHSARMSLTASQEIFAGKKRGDQLKKVREKFVSKSIQLQTQLNSIGISCITRK